MTQPTQPTLSPSDAIARLERARVRLTAGALVGNGGIPQAGALSGMLLMTPSAQTAIAATDGTRFLFNQAGISPLTDAQLVWLWAHELMHCMYGDMWRKPDWATWHEWNVATDYRNNGLLRVAGIGQPIPGTYDNPSYDGMSAEQIAHAERKAQQPQQPQPQPPTPSDDDDTSDSDDSSDDSSADDDSSPSDDSDDSDSPSDDDSQQADDDDDDDDDSQAGQPSDSANPDGTLTPTDDCLPPMQPSDDDDADSQQPGQPQPLTEQDWIEAVEQAEQVSRKAGCEAGWLSRSIAQAHAEPADWRAILRRFVEAQAPTDYTWQKLSRRTLSQGIFLPGSLKESTPPILVGVDTSGSISSADLAQFGDELTTILSECAPRALYVVYCDTRVAHVDVLTADDLPIELHAYGGGGTYFQPVFDYCAEQVDAGEWEQPACAIYLTDLENYGETLTEPDYPVLWATVPGTYRQPAFGEVVSLG